MTGRWPAAQINIALANQNLLLSGAHAGFDMPALPSIDVSVLIVSTPAVDQTAALLTSIHEQTLTSRYEVIVVEPGGVSGPSPQIANHAVKPRVLALPNALDFARACNLAATYARGRTVLLISADALLHDNTIDRLVEFARRNPAARVWGGQSCQSGETCKTAPPRSRLPAELRLGLTPAGPHGIFEPDLLMVEAALWHGLHGLDPVFANDGAAVDLCLRAQAFSARAIVAPNAVSVRPQATSPAYDPDAITRRLAASAALIQRHWRWETCWAGRFALLAVTAARSHAFTMRAVLSPTTSRAAACWSQVWARRHEWQNGYDVRGDKNILRNTYQEPSAQRAAQA